MLRVTHSVAIDESELSFTFARSSGPGGQNVNKVSSKALLRWKPATSTALPDDLKARLLARIGPRLTREGDLLITSQKYRDQARNIEDCREKLRQLVSSALAIPRRRRPTRPTRSSQEKRLQVKKRRGEVKHGRRTPGAD